MPFDVNSTSIVVDNESTRIQFLAGGGSTQSPDENNSLQYYRNSTFVFNKKSSATFSFSGPWVKVHGQKQYMYNSPVGAATCSIEPKAGTLIQDPDVPGGGSSFDTLCGFVGLSPSQTYKLTISGTSGAAIDYLEYGASNPKNGDQLRVYPRNPNFTFTNTTFADGYADLGENSGFNFTYTGASTITAYISRPDFDYPAQYNISYDFYAQSRRFSVPSQRVGIYLPVKLDSSVPVKYGPHWLSLKPINNDRRLSLDFVEYPYTSPPTLQAAPLRREVFMESARVGSVDSHLVIGDATKASIGLFFCIGALWWLFSAYRRKTRKGGLDVEDATSGQVGSGLKNRF